MKKRFLAIILCAMLMVMSLPQVAVTAFAEGIENTYESIKSAIAPRGTITASGSCGNPNANSGNNVLWKLESDGTLTVYPNPSPNGTDFSMKDISSTANMSSECPWYSNRTSIKSVIIDNGVTSVGKCSFYCIGVESITISNSVTSIGFAAFVATSITSIDIPSSVKSIGDYVFQACRSLASVNFSEGLTSIGTNVFSGCNKITSTNIPNSVTTIGASAFVNCTGLASITMPGSVTTVNSTAFKGCTNLTKAKITGTTSSSFPSWISSIPTTATLHYPLGNANWENNIALSDDGKFMCNGTHEVATNAVAYVDGDNTTIDFLSANENSVLPIASQQSTKLFEGWFDGITASPSTLTAPSSAYDGIYASDTPYQKVITAKYRDLGTVSKDPSDNNQTGVNTQGEFDQFGVQIRLDTLAYPGLRFITSFGNQLLNELQALNNQDVKYGYVVGLKSKISQNISSTDKIVQGTKGTRTVDCTRYDNTSDHKNFTNYRIFSLVITYEEGTGKDDEIVARPYVTYKDAQGVTHTFYGEYTGTNVYGGCCTTYNIARKAIGEGNLNNGIKK